LPKKLHEKRPPKSIAGQPKPNVRMGGQGGTTIGVRGIGGHPGYPVPPEMNRGQHPEMVDEKKEHTGFFSGLKVPDELAQELLDAGGEPDPEAGFHVTLVYQKEWDAAERKKVAKIIKKVAMKMLPIRASIDGLGRFPASESSDGKDVIYARVESKELHEFRDTVMQAIEKAGLDNPQNFPVYKPHITMRYVDQGEKGSVKPVEADDFDFEELIFTGIESPVNEAAVGSMGRPAKVDGDDIAPHVGGETVDQLMDKIAEDLQEPEAIGTDQRDPFDFAQGTLPPKSIKHVDKLKPESLARFLEGLTYDTLVVTEKVDGSCRLEFGRDYIGFWTRTKYGPLVRESWQHGYEPAGMAHRALDKMLGEGLNLKCGSVYSGEVMYGKIPNTIQYDGVNRIIVHGNRIPRHVRVFDEGQEWRIENPRLVTLPGWVLSEAGKIRYTYDPEHWALQVERRIMQHLSAPSAYGGKLVEGYVLRDPQTGEMAKLVNRNEFTETNRRYWFYRELLERGASDHGKWRPGVMAELRNSLTKSVGAQNMQTVAFKKRIMERAGSINQRLLCEAVSCHQKWVDQAIEQAKVNWARVYGEWKDVRYDVELPTEIKRRTDEAFKRTQLEIEDTEMRIKESGYSSLTIVREAVGPVRLARLTQDVVTDQVERDISRSLFEAPSAPSIGVTIGRFQPFHKGHGEVIRKLARQFSRVIIIVAGNNGDKTKNPFSYDLRVEMMEKSLPDVWSKLQVAKAEFEGKPSGYIPGVISDLVKGGHASVKANSAINILVGADRYDDIKKQIEHARKAKQELSGLLFDPDLAVVKALPDVQSDDQAGRVSGTQVRQALADHDDATLRKLLDQHLVSNEEDFETIVTQLEDALGAPGKPIEEDLQDVGGPQGLQYVITANSDLLKKRGINVDKLKELGHGQDGVAYDMGGARVLKVTTDEPEAQASLTIKGSPKQHVVKVYDVFRFPYYETEPGQQQQQKQQQPQGLPGSETNPARKNRPLPGSKTAPSKAQRKKIFGIVQEKLTPLSPQEEKEFNAAGDAWFGQPEVHKQMNKWDLVGIMKAIHDVITREVRERHGEADFSDLNDNPKTSQETNPGRPSALGAPQKPTAPGGTPNTEEQIRDEISKRYEQVRQTMEKFGMPGILRDLQALDISYIDFHGGNIMKRGNTYVINDLGRSAGGAGNPPVLEGIIEGLIAELGPASAGGQAGGAPGSGPGSVGLRAQSSAWSTGSGVSADEEEDGDAWRRHIAQVGDQMQKTTRGKADVRSDGGGHKTPG
jgi:cytidyltransferase-like protein